MKKRTLVSLLLLVVAFVATSATFAYWASGVNATTKNDEVNTITIGQGESIETTVSVTGELDTQNSLVPVSRANSVNNTVGSVKLTFTVEWNGADEENSVEGATATLTVKSVLDAAVEGLFIVSDVTPVELTYGQTSTFTITVTFENEPSNKTEYDLVAGKDLNLTATFTLSGVTTK